MIYNIYIIALSSTASLTSLSFATDFHDDDDDSPANQLHRVTSGLYFISEMGTLFHLTSGLNDRKHDSKINTNTNSHDETSNVKKKFPWISDWFTNQYSDQIKFRTWLEINRDNSPVVLSESDTQVLSAIVTDGARCPRLTGCVFGLETHVWLWNSLNNQPCRTLHAHKTLRSRSVAQI